MKRSDLFKNHKEIVKSVNERRRRRGETRKLGRERRNLPLLLDIVEVFSSRRRFLPSLLDLSLGLGELGLDSTHPRKHQNKIASISEGNRSIE